MNIRSFSQLDARWWLRGVIPGDVCDLPRDADPESWEFQPVFDTFGVQSGHFERMRCKEHDWTRGLECRVCKRCGFWEAA